MKLQQHNQQHLLLVLLGNWSHLPKLVFCLQEPLRVLRQLIFCLQELMQPQ